MAIYQKLTSAVLGGDVMERELPSHSLSRTKSKREKFVIKLEEKHV